MKRKTYLAWLELTLEWSSIFARLVSYICTSLPLAVSFAKLVLFAASVSNFSLLPDDVVELQAASKVLETSKVTPKRAKYFELFFHKNLVNNF